MMPLFFYDKVTYMKLFYAVSLCASLWLFLVPLIIGLIGVVVPAAGYFPALGATSVSLSVISDFLAQKATLNAMWLSLFIGMTASLFSVVACFALMACGAQAGFGRRVLRLHRRIMGPLIALPHSTIAIALLFLLAPSGWLVRLVSPELTGWVRPPAFGFVPDQTGWLLIGGLMMKEIPFLLFIALAQSQRLALAPLQHLGNSFGYAPVVTWFYLIWPQIYRQMRLPLLAVFAYSLSVVDMTLILGPGLPPPLAVLILQGFYDADLSARLPASAGAALQILIIFFAIGLWLIGERICAVIMRLALSHGARLALFPAIVSALFIAVTAAFICVLLGLCAIALWAFANRWPFSAKWPSDFGLRFWQSEAAFGTIAGDTIIIALGASLISVAIAAFWLEILDALKWHRKSVINLLSLLLFIPLFVPQISLLFGLQVALSWSYLDGYHLTVIFVHCLYILPYVWLILAPAYQGYERRYQMLAHIMGYGIMRHFWRVRLPVLGHSFASAIILGVAVSIALYLPTIFAGAGRISTITTEAVTLAASGARGPSAQAAFMQMLLPLCAFAIIRALLHIRYRRFSAMQANQS